MQVKFLQVNGSKWNRQAFRGLRSSKKRMIKISVGSKEVIGSGTLWSDVGLPK